MPVFNFADYEVDRGKFTTENRRILKDMHCPMTEYQPVLYPDREIFYRNSYEHTIVGHDSEEIEDINNQMRKRMRKLLTCASNEDTCPKLYGPQEADATIVSWAATKAVFYRLEDFPMLTFYILPGCHFPKRKSKRGFAKSQTYY